MSQSGEYQCVASNKFGVIYSNHSILSVVSKYQFGISKLYYVIYNI